MASNHIELSSPTEGMMEKNPGWNGKLDPKELDEIQIKDSNGAVGGKVGEFSYFDPHLPSFVMFK